ncbi:MAG: hypothetical protein A3J74_11530 [Elusimicrobia bacterium RIFCSPHIGHO2_02_FULL_57_9]|nr:MAG: hypothetical protein A3J74_11530 [Elusimicrobia bacterium RIFCSPHIGHO2_02_FULL_57_9]
MKRRLLRFLCALVLGLVFYDNIADAAGCHDSPAATATTCHVCSCGPHIFSQDSAPAIVVLQPTACAAYETPVYALLLPQSIFHPPRSIA